MLNIDIRVISVVSILVLLVIGYFVYLLYQDLVFLKKEVGEIKANSPDEDWPEITNDDLDSCDEEYDAEEDDEDEEDRELDRHLESFMNKGLYTVTEEPLEEPVEITSIPENSEITQDESCDLHEQEICITQDNQEMNIQPKPKRAYKKKN